MTQTSPSHAARLATIHVGAVALLVLVACLGTRARDHALFPAVAQAWPAVRADVELALGNLPPTPEVARAINQVEGAVRAGDWRLLRGANWWAMEPLALEGVAERVRRGEISEAVAGSFRERIKKFGEGLRALGGT